MGWVRRLIGLLAWGHGIPCPHNAVIGLAVGRGWIPGYLLSGDRQLPSHGRWGRVGWTVLDRGGQVLFELAGHGPVLSGGADSCIPPKLMGTSTVGGLGTAVGAWVAVGGRAGTGRGCQAHDDGDDGPPPGGESGQVIQCRLLLGASQSTGVLGPGGAGRFAYREENPGFTGSGASQQQRARLRSQPSSSMNLLGEETRTGAKLS